MTFEERFKHSIAMQPHAVEYYSEYLNIKKVINVDALGQSDNDMKTLDFSGIDNLIVTEDDTIIHIAQRFRRDYDKDGEWVTPDFSLRYKSYSDGQTEYEKVKKAHYGISSMPNLYGFGREPYGREVAEENGFDEFYLIDLETLAAAHFEGSLSGKGPHPNGDGSMGLYFDLDDLRRHDCIICEWCEAESVPQANAPPEQRRGDITAWSATNES